jgi:hypothetical protein
MILFDIYPVGRAGGLKRTIHYGEVMKFRTKREITDGSSKQGFAKLKLNLDRDVFDAIQRIAEENNTYASEIIRQLMADFVEKYEQEHNDEAKQ